MICSLIKSNEDILEMKSSRLSTIIVVLCSLVHLSVYAQDDLIWGLNLPSRPLGARTGSEFVETIQSLNLEQREQAIQNEIFGGNVPDFIRNADTITFVDTLAGDVFEVSLLVLPDYLSIGSNDDYVLMPMTPILAQQVMDRMGGIFPTRKIVDMIWNASEVKFKPIPIPPSKDMVTIEVFNQHNKLLNEQKILPLWHFLVGVLVSGHKKDVILSNHIASYGDKVVIYGWHYQTGKAIQPMYKGHAIWYVDYSHGIRVVYSRCLLNGSIKEVDSILKDPVLYKLFSDEDSPMTVTRYDTSQANYP